MKRLLSAISFLLLTAQSMAQEKRYDITTYGAMGDSKTVATKSIQAAVDACNAEGGGKVIIPAGVFIIGTVHLKSNVHLYLQSGAVLRGSSNLDDYEIFIPDQPFTPVHKGMLFTEDAENITISGEGQVDGNGDVFFDLNSAKKIGVEGTKFTRQKEGFRKVESGIGDGPVVPKDRPYQMFVFSNCKRVTIKDIFVTKAPFWCMHFADCDAVNVTGIRLWNSMLAPNADGIDITSCTNVTISNCDIRAGDDAIAITGYDHHFEIPGYKKLRHISENILVTNCNLQSYSSGIRIGFLDQNTVRNIQVSNCNITNSSRGIGIFLRDEGSLENISFSNMYIETKLHTGDWWGNGEPIHISAVRGKEKVTLGKIKNINFRDIICKGETGLLVYGSAESIIEDVRFDNITFDLTDSKLNAVGGGNIDLRGAMREQEQLFARDIPGLLVQYVKNFLISDFKLVWSQTRMPYFTHGIEANNFTNLEIRNFTGTASPVNKTASRVSVVDGSGFVTDNKLGMVISRVK
ncbi:MAG: right-handed parallel beta-helix repeat-containing protein [Ferruginibacter sp.]|nr:right-handed parallel beta-helix repeat-containing protein [Ferruginibacter sp.]